MEESTRKKSHRKMMEERLPQKGSMFSKSRRSGRERESEEEKGWSTGGKGRERKGCIEKGWTMLPLEG